MIYYPNKEQIEQATQVQLARWMRFLRFAETDEESKLIDLIDKRFQELGGMTPEISKLIGWDK